ncbi:conserved hypothetical protein [Oleispira antarctica RB-8]|uniref:DUF3240 domain-containing protein n=1 Tax=Oleispira antarctica RB-8 TaxID=698738 RepID=R4YMB2_OLEAN|nr:conserved hypothetical protein [Oleispira antarctica RB-8]
MNQALLTLSTAPGFEDELVDWLLVSQISGFSSWVGYGHGADVATLSIAEQVAGRQKRVFFTLEGDSEKLSALIELLSADYPNADVHYWLQPVLMSGRIKR